MGNNALKIMDWILEDMASSGGDDKDLRNAPFGIGLAVKGLILDMGMLSKRAYMYICKTGYCMI